MQLFVADVVAALEERYPPSSAMSWDRVGLAVGDPAAAVRRIHLAVDPTLAVIEEAARAGADLLITHHPLLLRGVHSVAVTHGKGAAITAAITAGLAVYCAHTNADVASPGVSDALASAIGLTDVSPLAVEESQPLGRVGQLPEPETLVQFATRLSRVLPPAPGGIRVAGPPDAVVQRVAVLGGAGDTLFAAARRVGADVYVTADLRHHPASEAREESRGRPPYLVDAGHWATEWLWLGELAEQVPRDVGYALSPADSAGGWRRADGTTVEVYVSKLCTDPWQFVVGAHVAGGAS